MNFSGEKVQIDIKYVPRKCLDFDSHGIRYYQITAIDEYFRKRHYKIVDEQSVTHTADFMLILEKELGFKIHTVQTANDLEVTKKETIFEKTLKHLNIQYKTHDLIHLGKMEKLNEVILKIKKYFMISEAFNQLNTCTSNTNDACRVEKISHERS